MNPQWHSARRVLLQCTSLGPPNPRAAEVLAEERLDAEVPTLAACAAFHGMGPLLRHHMQGAAGPALRRSLQELGARQRRAAAARNGALGALLAACAEREIPVLLLKGAALQYAVYPHPALRPMRDIDLLVDAPHAAAMVALMADQGFVPGGGVPPGHHHLPPFVRRVDDHPVSVEIHSHLGLSHRASLSNSTLFAQAVPCSLDAGAQGWMPAPLHMVWHIYHHAFAMPFTTEPTKLIWWVDLRATLSRWAHCDAFCAALAQTPKLMRIVHHVHAVEPLTALGEKLGLARAPRPLLALDYTGWPRTPLRGGPLEHRLRGLRATLRPPRFWLGMRHAVGLGWRGGLKARLLHLRDLLQKLGDVTS